MSAARPLAPGLKLALEMGPLAVFFLANARPALLAPLVAPLLPQGLAEGQRGLFVATAAFMATMLVALAVHFALARRLPIMPLVSGALVLVFGGLTLWLADERFIKMKPTLVNLLFGGTLLGGLALGRPLLPLVLDAMLDLDDEGWRKLTLRWGLFFLVLAALNEAAWRGLSTDAWINFKVFAIAPLTLAFALAQTPLILRHARAAPEGPPPNPSPDGG